MSVPYTWTALEAVPASRMNTELRDRMNALAAKPFVLSLGDPDGPPLTVGVKSLFMEFPFGVRPTGWTIIGNVAGSIVVDVIRKPYATGPPVGTDTIAGSQKPTLVATVKNQNLNLTTWSDIAAGDLVGLEIESVDGTLKSVSVSFRTTLLSFL